MITITVSKLGAFEIKRDGKVIAWIPRAYSEESVQIEPAKRIYMGAQEDRAIRNLTRMDLPKCTPQAVSVEFAE